MSDYYDLVETSLVIIDLALVFQTIGLGVILYKIFKKSDDKKDSNKKDSNES